MKSLILLIIAFLSSTHLLAQPFNIAYSEPFEEPRGRIELLQLQDGKTAFIAISEENIHVRIFDKGHALIADQKTKHDRWTERKISAAEYKGTYKAGENIIIFFTQLYRGNMLALHRLIFSPVTGQMLKTDEIARIPTRRSYGYSLESIVINDFYITQDPVTENYAVLIFEGYTAEKPNRAKVQVYGTNNNLLKEATPENTNRERYVHFAGMCMNNNNVFLCVNDYDPKDKSLSLPLYISELKADSDSFITEKITGIRCNKESESNLIYNTGTNTLYLTTHTITESQEKIGFNKTTVTKYYVTTVTTIDPAYLKVIAIAPYNTPKADAYARQHLGERKGFNGTRPDLITTYDSSMVWIGFENHGYSNGNRSWGSQSQMGISYLDNLGSESESYVIRIPDITGMALSRGTGVFGHKFISTKKGDYVIYNDLPENFNIPEKQQPHPVTSISDANTIILRLADGKTEKHYLFGAPENSKTSNFSRNYNAVYDKNTDMYITFMICNRDGKKKSYIAWINMNNVASK